MASKNGFSRSDHLKAEWAAQIFKESARTQTTARALHYFALGRQDYPLFTKAGLAGLRTYVDSDAAHLTKWIALAKRLTLIPWDAAPDESVGEYNEMVFNPPDCDFSYRYTLNRPQFYELSQLKTYLEQSNFVFKYTPIGRGQPYHLELWVEKATMDSILRPVCAKRGAVLVTFKGHCSWGAVWKSCKRANDADRPALMFYLSDLDSSGFRMGVELSEKIAEINDNFYGGQLDIRVRRIGLTPGQVVDFKIPLVDRKSTELANNHLYKNYVESYDLNPTKKAELDALERYYPGGVAAFVDHWLSSFYDSELGQRCDRVTREYVRSIPEVYELPENVVSCKRKILACLEDLIRLEDDLEVPQGREIGVNLEPKTSDPDEEAWLLDIQNDISPSQEDVDFAVVE